MTRRLITQSTVATMAGSPGQFGRQPIRQLATAAARSSALAARSGHVHQLAAQIVELGRQLVVWRGRGCVMQAVHPPGPPPQPPIVTLPRRDRTAANARPERGLV